ncbi:unannotated protein [freshwater metagenome]|uniref:Unannotated protein n=1 Tax=freshwater metagenome TaxID=449393 RepID=A0A6J6P4E9_9ZZZZ
MVRRLVVVSAHPDDESLGGGGLIALASRLGLTVYVVLLTAGESSHPSRDGMTRHALATTRLAEMENALARLAPDAPLVFLGAIDGEVATSEDAIAGALADLLGESGPHTMLLAPWRHDGPPDHEAAGRAAAEAARRTGALLVEYPLSFWRHARPDDAPWSSMRRVDLDDSLREVKAAAIRCHSSQAAALSGRLLSHFTSEFEHYVVVAPA